MARVKIRRRRPGRPRSASEGLEFVDIKMYAVGLILDPSVADEHGLTLEELRKRNEETLRRARCRA